MNTTWRQFPRRLRSTGTMLLLLLPSFVIAAVCAYAVFSYRVGQRAALLEQADLTLSLLVGHRPFGPAAPTDRASQIEMWTARVGQLRQRLPRVRYVMLLDGDGRDLSGGRLDAATCRTITTPSVVTPSVFSFGGPPVAHVRRPLRDVPNAFVHIGLEAGPVWASSTTVVFQVAVILAGALALNLFMVRRTLLGLIRPINSLSQQSRALASGEAVDVMAVEGPEEITQLSHALNAMLARQRQDAARIHNTVREVAEERVKLAAEKATSEFERRRLRAMVESLHEGVVFLNAEGKVEFANEAALGLLGCGQGGLLGRSVSRDQIGVGIPPRVALERLVGDAAWSELSKTHELDLSKVAVAGDDGLPAGTMIIIRDRTHERRLQRQLAEQEKIATVGMLAAGVAHEINNPLDGLQNCLRRIVNDPTNTAQIERYAGLMTASLSHIGTVVRQLLDLSHKRDRQLRPLSIHDVLHEAVALAVAGRQGREVEIEWHLADELPPVLADWQNMVQVFLNLTLNAFHAMPSGGRLVVRTAPDTELAAAEEGGVMIELTDTGCGITPEIRARIFEPFFTTSADGTGTGLGLTVSRNLIIEHGGEIEVESEPGRGTTFRVRLPRHFASQQRVTRP